MTYEELAHKALALDTRPICKYCGTKYSVKPKYKQCYTCGAERTIPSIRITCDEFIELMESKRSMYIPFTPGGMMFMGAKIEVVP